MKYENRIIFFLDILGFKAHVMRTVDGEQDNEKEIKRIYEILSEIENTREDAAVLSKTKKVTHFSDSLIISFAVHEPGEVYWTLTDLFFLQLICASQGVLVRGGAALGKAIHTDTIVFGPAVVAAYETESKVAIYPRIVLDQSVLEAGTKYPLKINTQTEELNDINDIITEDFDGLHYIDYTGIKIESQMDTEFQYPEYLESLRALISTNITHRDLGVRAKYLWLKAKYNHAIKEIQASQSLATYKSTRPELYAVYNELKPV